MRATEHGVLMRAQLIPVEGGPPVETMTIEGTPFVEIVRAAQNGGFDLIVLGKHGRSGLKQLLIGSTAEKVVRKAPCAVLTVRAETEFEHPAAR